MNATEKFRVNYYVGALLAQGGNLTLEDSKIVFSPTSALDRAMGAVDVAIPFQQILGMESKGTLSRSVHIKTNEKIHKFEGGQAQKFWDALQRIMSNGAPATDAPVKPSDVKAAPPPAAGFQCDRCLQPIQPGYFFCPHCAQRLKSVCVSCHKAVDPTWAACAFCGWKFSSALH